MAFGEDELIARLFRPIAGASGLGLLDDAACLTPPAGKDIVITADALVAGVHFFADDPPASIARKALRVNLSDLAAKGADPAGFVLSLALPRELPDSFLQDFAASLGDDLQTYACPLIGGDTVATPGPLMIAITAFGFVPKGTMVRRTAARAGDLAFVTGTIGDGALGLLVRQGKLAEFADGHLLQRYLEPRPRNALAAALRAHARAAMDVSDGLAGDLMKLARVSGVGLCVRSADVPLSPAARAAIAADSRLRAIAFTGGDDYEIAGSVAPDQAAALIAAGTAAGIPLTIVGEFTADPSEMRFVECDGSSMVLASLSFSHFSESL